MISEHCAHFLGKPLLNIVNILLLFEFKTAKSQQELMLGCVWAFTKLSEGEGGESVAASCLNILTKKVGKRGWGKQNLE